MNEHEEIAKASTLRRSTTNYNNPLPADFEDQATELENQEALEIIEKTETTEIHQIEAVAHQSLGLLTFLDCLPKRGQG